MNSTAASQKHLLALARLQCPIFDIIASHAHRPEGGSTALVPVVSISTELLGQRAWHSRHQV